MAATATADAAAKIKMPAPVLMGGFFARQVLIFVRMEGFPFVGCCLHWVLLAGLVGAPEAGPHAHA
jgi:hypothetical protein